MDPLSREARIKATVKPSLATEIKNRLVHSKSGLEGLTNAVHSLIEENEQLRERVKKLEKAAIHS